jgi:hypothetical protein
VAPAAAEGALAATDVAASFDMVSATTGAAGGLPGGLSAAPTPLLGRRHDEAAIVHLLGHDRCAGASMRLVTLTGPGGVGKTRLALQVA